MRRGKCEPYSREKAIMETNLKVTQILELTDKNFKVAIITMFKDMKENILGMNDSIENVSREINYKSKQMRILEPRHTVSEISIRINRMKLNFMY